MSVKAQAIASIQTMSEQATWHDLAERLRFLAAVDQADAEIARGEGIPHEEAKRQINECLQKLSGRQAV